MKWLKISVVGIVIAILIIFAVFLIKPQNFAYSEEVTKVQQNNEENKAYFSWLQIVTNLILVISTGSFLVYRLNRKNNTKLPGDDFEILE